MNKKIEDIINKTIEKTERFLYKHDKKANIISAISISYLSGLTLGAVGRNYNKEIIPVLPLFLGFNANINWTTPFYLAGVATNYSKEIYETIEKYI